jgi:DNA invertase Pin-like site-specific DNA recombinase
MSRHSTPGIAYSYIRFSHPSQAEGDSLRRQTAEAVAWCQRNNVQLDTSITLHDLGKSAYTGKHRQNPDRNALAAFLKLVERGKVPPGSYLVIENLDRLSREEEVPACHLLTSILMAGVRVVQLSPSELILTDKSPGWDIMRAVMELSRGHGESARKSDLIGKAWREKKRKARESGEVLTSQLPAWLQLIDGKIAVIPERAAVVKRIFELSIAGYGLTSVVGRLTREGIPVFTCKAQRKNCSGGWSRSYLSAILKDRRAVGEYQPRRADGAPDGPPVPGYYPAIVSEDLWLAARGAADKRGTYRGRMGEYINLFSGLLHDARHGCSYVLTTQRQRNGSCKRILLNTDGAEGRAQSFSFPLPAFEEAVLSHLKEIDPREILTGVNGHDNVLALEGEQGELETAIAAIGAELDARGESPLLYSRLRAKEARLTEVVKELTAAQQRAANPLSASWGEMKSLLEALTKAPDVEDARLRLRAALRRIVEGIRLLVVPRGRDRLAAVQIWFAGAKRHRDYLIYYRPTRFNGKVSYAGGWRSRSLAGVVRPGELDLRKREHAEDLAARLAGLDMQTLAAALGVPPS